jgi:DNA polymerase-4
VGVELRLRACGVDPRPVVAEPGEAVSISSEETFDRDVSDRAALHEALRQMAAEVTGSLIRRGWAARTVTTKLRYPDFSIVTRSHSLAVGTDDTEEVATLACALLDKALTDRPDAIRLAGVGVSGLERHKQLTLLGDSTPAQTLASV